MKKYAIVAITTFVTLAAVIGCGGRAPQNKSGAAAEQTQAPVHADVTVFIMSRCPHCASLLQTLLPLRRELGDAVTLSVAWVGNVNADGKADLSSADAEVRTAQLQICAGISAGAGPWLQFMECLYTDDTWQSLPDGWETCAARNGVDADAVGRCVADGVGEQQLRESIEVSASEGIRGVPMVFINGQPYIGKRDRESLLARICHGGNGETTMPAICAAVPKPQAVEVTLIEDLRCAGTDECIIERELAFLGALMPSMNIQKLDYSSDEGRRIYADVAGKTRVTKLPVMVIRDSLATAPEAQQLLVDMLIPFEAGFVLPLGGVDGGWDPTREICDNDIDDNGDGAMDCADEDCAKLGNCRPEIKNRIDLFVMSQCPYGAMMMPLADHFLNHMRRDRAAVDFRIQFVGDERDGVFESMHGPSEVEENIRTLCVQELYPNNYQFMEYVLCRARDYHSNEWKPCVGKKMSADKISDCVEGEQGRKLLSTSFALSNELTISASPTWVYGNRDEVDVRTSTSVFEAFCARNDLEICKTPIKPLLIDNEGDAPPSSCQ